MDSSTVNILLDKSFYPEIIKMLISGVFIFIAAYLAFRFGLKKDRIINKEKDIRRLKKLKYFVHFSISKLIKPSEIQLNYINEFKEQFKSDEIDIIPIQLSAPFFEDNFSWIPSIDIYEIFINMSMKPMEEKSKALSNFIYCLKVTKQVSDNLESDMNKYRSRANELGQIYNKVTSDIRNEINLIIKNGIDREFIDDFNTLREQKLKLEKLADFKYMFTEFYAPLLSLAEKHKVFSLIQILPELNSINLQFKGLKEQYYRIYDNFCVQLSNSIVELKKIEMFLEDTNTQNFINKKLKVMSSEKDNLDLEIYKISIETRNLEIKMFWQRSNYFLVLNTAIVTGVFLSNKMNSFFPLIISIFGLLSSFLWININLGSKFWQTRWEKKTSDIEDSLETKIISNLFSVSKEEVKEDVNIFLKKDKHKFPRTIIDKFTLCKPSVSMQMLYLSMLFFLLYAFLICYFIKINYCI